MKYVFGHTNPDTDSYCSAVAYARYLQDTGEEAQAIALGQANFETKFVFNYVGLTLPEVRDTLPAGTEVVLVDHNASTQSIQGRDELVIDEVIDHHNIIDYTTGYPVTVRCEKVGCTCTILAEMFQQAGYTPSAKIAHLMVSAIISDTFLFRSPTTTARDRKALVWLQDLTGIDDLEGYARQMFDAKSDLGDTPVEQLVKMDYKTFEFSGKNVGVGVMETTNPAYALGRKQEILGEMRRVKSVDELAHILFCVVDILQEQMLAFVCDEDDAHIVEQVFATHVVEHQADLGNRVSRKKQLVPPLDAYFKSL